ncbi:MAG: hypothetical protein CL608_16730 [Anaerolineaceae bacterium]|nr:hypothetical protein [Anaerolineaceae bacterium]
MTTLIGLFKDQKTAEAAVDALTAADLDDVEFETILSWDEEQEKEVKVAPAFTGYGSSGAPVAMSHVPSWNLDDEEERFFKRTVQHGGVLIVVDVDDEDQVPQVNRILEENSEKVAVSS